MAEPININMPITSSLPYRLVVEIDKVRGDKTRSGYIRQAVERAVKADRRKAKR